MGELGFFSQLWYLVFTLVVFGVIIKWWGVTFQNPASRRSQRLDWFHDYICLFLIWIVIRVGFFLFFLRKTKWLFKGSSEHSWLEFFWTITPAFVLIFIGVPSMHILYRQRVDRESDITLKVTGNQWFWSYNYLDFNNISFDSFIIPVQNLSGGGFRLLDTDNRIILPVQSNIRLGVCASDVLHAWAMPSLGLKVDAVPGRINFLNIYGGQVGLFFGQCREICGSNHRFIPIVLEITRFSLFKSWIQIFSLR